MKRLCNWLGALALLIPLAAGAMDETPAGDGAAQTANPQEVVRHTADTVLAEVTKRRKELEADNSLIYPLVERTVVPHFDFTRMARAAMGRFWRRATPEQQRRIVAEFQEMLVRTYATALLGYSGQNIEYPPVHMQKDAKRVLVPTKVSAEGGPPIPINYRLRLEKNGQWKVYDVVIDGVSLVTNYRSSFARLIRQGASRAKDRSKRMQAGIDNLIRSLQKKNDESAAGKTQLPKEAA